MTVDRSTPTPPARARSYAFIGPGPAWVPGATVYGQDPSILAAHLDHMRRLYDDGRLLLGGPEAHGRAGFALLDTADLTEASRLLDADPCVRSGIFRFSLHHLTPYFDRADGTRHAG